MNTWVCHSCLQNITIENSFCTTCSLKVFGKRNLSAILPFSTEELADKLPSQLQKNSLLGYQNKIYLKIDNTWTIPQWATPSHLLKLPDTALVSAYKLALDMPANEHLSMQIAKQIFGIPTVECAFLHTEDNLPLYITKLFDVSTAKDFAVLLSITPHTHGENYKYEGHYEEIANYLVQYSEDKQTDLFNFFKCLVLNFIIRNGDAHLRNFAMFYNNKNLFTLTPLYDVLNTVLHLEDESLACYLYKGDIHKVNIRSLNKMSRKKILAFAETFRINTSEAKDFLDEMYNQKSQIYSLIARSFLSDRAKQIYAELVENSYKILFR